jgi:hypothetical protein
MSMTLSVLSSRTKYKVDFALVPFAILLIEFAVLMSQFSGGASVSFGKLLQLRLIHSFLMLAIAFIVSQVYIRVKKVEVSYLALAITGVLVIGLGDIIHILLAPFFDVELISGYRRFWLILVQGAIWFPAFQIIAGNRVEIFRNFGEYERRLIAATRAQVRTSASFKALQDDLHKRIKSDLNERSSALKESISSAIEKKAFFPNPSEALGALLLGEDLRALSTQLGSLQDTKQSFLRRNLESLTVLFQQFLILRRSAVKKSPLPQGAYAAILLGLVTPLFIYFYSGREALIELPILLLVLLLITNLIARAQRIGSAFLLNASTFLIFVTGLIPLLLDLFGEPFGNKPGNHFPLLISSCVLPITYYISMELFQVLRPTALKLIESDELEAGSVLKNRVSRTVIDELSSNLSHQWAVFIHGKILTRLAATALKIEASSKSGDSNSFYDAIKSLIVLLESPDSDFESQAMSLGDEVSSRLNPWKGLLEIDLEIDPELIDVSNSRVRDSGEVIEELISNSIRHGKSRNLSIKVARLGERDLEIVSIDDAIEAPPADSARSGLGTRIFNLASDGRWSLTRLDSGTEFRLTMSFER